MASRDCLHCVVKLISIVKPGPLIVIVGITGSSPRIIEYFIQVYGACLVCCFRLTWIRLPRLASLILSPTYYCGECRVLASTF